MTCREAAFRGLEQLADRHPAVVAGDVDIWRVRV
jgi:hypothetical protein